MPAEDDKLRAKPLMLPMACWHWHSMKYIDSITIIQKNIEYKPIEYPNFTTCLKTFIAMIQTMDPLHNLLR